MLRLFTARVDKETVDNNKITTKGIKASHNIKLLSKTKVAITFSPFQPIFNMREEKTHLASVKSFKVT